MLEEISGITVNKFAYNKTEIMFMQCHYPSGLITIVLYYTNQVTIPTTEVTVSFGLLRTESITV